MVIIKDDNSITYRLKIDNGQIVELKISWDIYMDTYYYYVTLYINKRKNGYKFLEQTGRNGIEGLLKAKEMLREFIEDIKQTENRNHNIYIFWDDNRRKDVYERGLKDLGFKMTTCIKWKCLRLGIPRKT